MQEAGLNPKNIDNYHQPEECAGLRNLSQVVSPGIYQLLVATEGVVLRGTDLRA